jgi:hypothetical protein
MGEMPRKVVGSSWGVDPRPPNVLRLHAREAPGESALARPYPVLQVGDERA